MGDNSKEKVAIIGSGLIGRSWSMLFAAADYQVSLYDISGEQLAGALGDIERQLGELERLGLLRGRLPVADQLANIATTDSFDDCVAGAAYIQECVPESQSLKQSVLGRADGLMSDTAILASSTSALLPSVIAANLRHRHRFVVAHPTNPPFYAPMVELVPGPWTDEDVVPATRAIMERLGQVPVLLNKEIEGFVLNRIQYAIFKEGWRLIKDGIVSVDGLDKVMSAGLGRRYAFMGPFETAYLNAEGMYVYAERYATMIEGIMATFREPDPMSGPVLEQIQTELEKRVPLDGLQERRHWRDIRLAGLAKMINKLDSDDVN